MKNLTISLFMACAFIIGACSESPVDETFEPIEHVYDRCYGSWLNNVWCE